MLSGIYRSFTEPVIEELCVGGGFILTFFKVLFFGVSIQLTSSPVDIDVTPLEIEAPKVLNVVTTGAHLRIDISNNVKTGNLLEARNDATSKYPEGCVEAKMITKDKKSYVFSNQGVLWFQGAVLLSLSHTGELDTELEFTRVVIYSCESIRGAEVSWVNYKH